MRESAPTQFHDFECHHYSSFLNPLSPYRNQVKRFLFHKMYPQSTEVCMDTKRSFFSRHVYSRSWGFTQQTLNDTIFCMPRTCAPAVVGSAWALSMSSSKSVCACAESCACSAACWTVYRNLIFFWALPQTKSEWNKWKYLRGM